ncbi:uncharacterized protein PGTG_22422 [Puccinia graminis f. sp. tritici CRL 75-36-700-3]|uniref:Uncharacterized protein n=1 Tax=Puccinia graminis f. sp. tritici (strain CRL 75-36-700-3 / race SCCL) TaxID=418459 RepID=H6QUL2_PUCGT|nr:uncharacterized protein PGTG_22422 [Puccinia graminis f. sp. tritici CRL 75-36-700-3]EHS64726.1 hypothetical protein PGTG_22422 [Puccinia graminis f. sp. tritici CRL 75-36-700-3]
MARARNQPRSNGSRTSSGPTGLAPHRRCTTRKETKGAEGEAMAAPSHLLQAIPSPHTRAIKRGPIMRGQVNLTFFSAFC